MGIVLIITNSCKKEADYATQIVDQLSDSALKIIDAAGIDTVSTFKDALFPDGTNISEWDSLYRLGYKSGSGSKYSNLSAYDKKKLFIANMSNKGFYLVDDNQHTYPSQPNGLAYVFGSKIISGPSKYPDAICQDLLFGLDCSGMIYQMAKGSRLNLPSGGTYDYVNISTWNNAFKNSPDYEGLEMTDLQALPTSQMQAGDILVASGKHIGMVFDNGGVLGIFNSLGSPDNTCSVNMAINHGTVITKNIPSWWLAILGSNYHVLRVKSITPVINNTTWDVTIFFNATTKWHANVTFNADGTTKYDEPDNPGLYLTYGVWSMNNDHIRWSMGLDPNYIFKGSVFENTMSGSFVFGGLTKNWIAVKR